MSKKKYNKGIIATKFYYLKHFGKHQQASGSTDFPKFDFVYNFATRRPAFDNHEDGDDDRDVVSVMADICCWPPVNQVSARGEVETQLVAP